MKHTVHLMTTVRVKARGIEADTHEEACEKAYEETDLTFLSGFSHDGTEYDYAEEITAMLVDEDDDEDYEKSTWHDMGNKQLSSTAHLRWVEPKGPAMSEYTIERLIGNDWETFSYIGDERVPETFHTAQAAAIDAVRAMNDVSAAVAEGDMDIASLITLDELRVRGTHNHMLRLHPDSILTIVTALEET